MAINFPSTSGQPIDGSYTHTVGNVTWSWDGSSWTASSNTGSGGGGGGGATSLNGLSDVNVSAPITDGHILNWDNTNNEWFASGNINIDGNINLEGYIELGPDATTKISATDATLGHWNTVIENSTNGDIFIKGAELLLQANHTGVTKTWVHGNTDYSVDLYHDGDVALSTSSSGIQVEANNTGIPGLQGEVNVGVSGNCKVLAFSDNGNNSAEDNNTFKIYSQHGTTNTTKTSILYESFYDQVWRVYGEGGSGCSGISHAELGRINHDGGWELRYHDIQGTAPNWTGTTCDKKLETTAGGVDVTGALDVSGKLTVTGIDSNGQYNIKPGGEFFKFENSSAWSLSYDDGGSGSGWSYAINATKDYVKLYGPGGSGSTVKLETTTNGAKVTGSLEVTSSIEAASSIVAHSFSPGDNTAAVTFYQVTNSGNPDTVDGRAYTSVYSTIHTHDAEDLFVELHEDTIFEIKWSNPNAYANDVLSGALDYGRLASFKPQEGVKLFYNDDKKFETSSTGVKVTGKLDLEGVVYEKVKNDFTTALTPSGAGVLDIDTSQSTVFVGALAASVTTWNFTNITVGANDPNAITLTLVIDSNSLYSYGDAVTIDGTAVTGGIRWSGGIAPTSTNNEDILTFTIVYDESGNVRVYGTATLNYS